MKAGSLRGTLLHEEDPSAPADWGATSPVLAYRMALKPADVRAFLERPWGTLEAARHEHRAERAREDPEWAWHTAQALREDVRRPNPGWPTEEDRERDLEHHVRLKALIDRASRELLRRGRL